MATRLFGLADYSTPPKAYTLAVLLSVDFAGRNYLLKEINATADKMADVHHVHLSISSFKTSVKVIV